MELSINPLDSVLNFGSKLLDKFIPDPAQKAAAQLELVKLSQSGELAKLAADTQLAQGQLDINKIEAASSDRFVSGGRPFIIWVCGVGLGVQFIVSPLLTFFAELCFNKHIVMPNLDTGTLLALLASLLGTSYMRSQEKLRGIA
jgi:hypothetical protein